MTSRLPFQVLLYYKFVPIPDPEQFTAEHLTFCKELGLKGRILIASEGINGTVSGTIEQTEAYMRHMHSNPLFADMVFKIDEAEDHTFRKMFVRHKKELVTLRYEKELDPNKVSGKRLSPVEFHEMLQRDDVIILDGRSDYEFDLGHFRGAIRPNLATFKEFPEWIRNNMNEEYRDRPILTYCTGGIRCEKLTGVLINEGFPNVYQLDGGIVTYGKDPVVKGHLWDGKCYVFDERISVPINRTDEQVVVGKCYHCGGPAETYINCADDTCHRQHLVCEACDDIHHGYCSAECEEHITAG
ncbi:oxygen-dependent tRNA uridine(34) hydroxylase TrhO [Paenibacillus xylaniclasticus]|uniref:oxygen-dependent tRNA uridine(34) hydroxylase TrhO n=1 Tax=Paenibacillus xylaniclasticus TaxID=588083 RepID=UPI000FDC53CB|nr:MULTISPECIES: rhodanese-related sulfurtransferase [Paenibacillus]GFN31690.1 UPF0176 protein YbfQ [Paenibacillus curdlanolyticus]